MTPEAEVHALRQLVGGLLFIAAKTDRAHLEEMLEQAKITAGVSPAAMDAEARRILPDSCRLQRELLEGALGIDPA